MVPPEPAFAGRRPTPSACRKTEGARCLLRDYRQLGSARAVSTRSLAHMAQLARSPFAASLYLLGATQVPPDAVSAPDAGRRPLNLPIAAKPSPEEPDAVVPHARIRGGPGRATSPAYPTLFFVSPSDLGLVRIRRLGRTVDRGADAKVGPYDVACCRSDQSQVKMFTARVASRSKPGELARLPG